MKSFYVLLIFFFLLNCSFDDKSGIWKSNNKISKKNNDLFEKFESISLTQNKFNKIITLDENYKFYKTDLFRNFEWRDIFFSKNNKLENYTYNNSNQLIYKSKKLTKHKINKYILFEKNNLIASDIKGNVVVFSINEKKKFSELNFYKKRYKKIDKFLNMIVEENIIYISDNLGFIYAFNYYENKVIWATNYKIPFRSNIKIFNDKLILADQNNSLLIVDKNDGKILKTIPSEESVVKNEFKSNIAIYKKNIIFLNTYGSLYSINIENLKINWFINLNQSLDINPSNLFTSNELIVSNDKIYVPTKNNFYILDFLSGSTIFKKDFTSVFRPLVIKNLIYAIDNNFLIAMNVETGDILFSYNINQKISDYLNVKKKMIDIKKIMLADNKIFIFLKNSYILQINFNGSISQITKLREKINSNPIFIDNSILFINNKNKISIIN
tara:strand:+ start:256 stop:1578 length:1323 start_codon:yes stop_codon:yes gene_type:complete